MLPAWEVDLLLDALVREHGPEADTPPQVAADPFASLPDSLKAL